MTVKKRKIGLQDEVEIVEGDQREAEVAAGEGEAEEKPSSHILSLNKVLHRGISIGQVCLGFFNK